MSAEMPATFFARPLLPLTLSLMSGIVGGAWMPGFTGVSLAILVTAIGFCLHSRYKHRQVRLAPLLTFFLSGYLSILPWVAPRFPSNHIVHFADRQKYRVIGIVSTQPVSRVNRSRFILDAEHIEVDGIRRRVTGKLRLTVGGDGVDIRRGDRIAADTRIRRVRNFNNPGGFDYERHMAFRKVWVSGYSTPSAVEVVAKNGGSGFQRLMDRARQSVLGLIEKSPPGDHRGVMAALILGNREHLSPEITEAFHRLGIGHLLAISGLHMGIVASAVFFLLVRVLARIRWFVWSAGSRKWAAVGTFFPVLAYALLAGMSPSTQRALVMVAVFLLAYLLERDQDLLNTLTVAALLLMAVDPPVVFSISFQLSFAAVFAIIFGMSRLAPLPIGAPVGLIRRVARKLFLFLLVSALATLGTLPFALLYFNQVSLVGILSNCIFVPVIGFGVVPTGLLAAFFLPVNAAVAEGLMHLSAGLLEQALLLSKIASDLPGVAVRTITPSMIEILCYYVLIGTAWELARTYRQKAADNFLNCVRPAPMHIEAREIRRRRLIGAVFLVAFVTMSLDVLYWSYQRFWRNDLRMTVLDVGQGNAALLELPRGYCLVVDGGGYADNDIFDVGARIIAPFLWGKKIRTIETLVLTHPNSDHLNGLIYLAEHFHVKTFWSNGESGNTRSYRQLVDTLQKKNILFSAFQQRDRRVTINGTEFEVLNPPPDFETRKHEDRWRDLNANSLVVRVTLGQHAILITGDITDRAETEIVFQRGDNLSSTVLLVPHHGSRSSSTDAFVRAVQPQFAVISAGWRNRYNFPHTEVLERYQRQQARILRTDRDGAIVLATDGSRLSIRTVAAGGM